MTVVEESTIPDNKRLCQCGCGVLIDKFDKRGNERYYKSGHNRRKHPHIIKTKINCFCGCGVLINNLDTEGRKRFYKKGHGTRGKRIPKVSGSNNRRFKGDKANYNNIHKYVNKYKARPIDQLCEFCHRIPHKQLANITGIYNTDFDNWKFLCISCHMKYDNKRSGGAISIDKKCCKCGSYKAYASSWYVIDKEKNLHQCGACYQKQRYLLK